MEKKTCLNCKYVSYVIENLSDPMNSIFYCMAREQIYSNCEICEFYQKDSRSNK